MIHHAVLTDAGRRRGENEDRVAADVGSGTFIVADGMGGLADAGTTAQMVVDELPVRLSDRVGELTGPDVVDLATAVAAELNEQVRRTARCGAGNTGAAAALLLVRAGRALAVHLGDSRIYLTRGGRLRRLTKDHALPAGQLTRFVGMNGVVRPGVSLHDLEAGDRMLLCTDGLTGGVDDYRVGALLATSSDVHVACRSLVDAARAGGSADDISMIAVEYGAREGWPSRG